MPAFLESWGTLLVAMVALVQPWLIAGWKRFFRAGSVEIHQTGTVELGYSGFGATIGLHGTLRARDRDFFVSSMSLEVVRQSDRSQHQLDWGLLRSHQVVMGRPDEVTVELPAGFMLMASQPHRYNILFQDSGQQGEMRRALGPVIVAWKKDVEEGLDDGSIKAPEDQQEVRARYESFALERVHVEGFTKVGQLTYWRPGRYGLTMTVRTARPDRAFVREWEFELGDEDAEQLGLNCVTILKQACWQNVERYNFAYVPYEAAEGRVVR
jgi:hypothetical protein